MLGLSTDKTESPKGLLSNLLGLKEGVKDDKFSLLLQSFSLGKKGDKEHTADELDIKSFDTLDPLIKLDSKEDTKAGPTKLLTLFSLGNEEGSDEEQLHPDIVKLLPNKEVKQNIQMLIGEAKSYLKEQIALKTDVKTLPKTLGGLIKLAESSGIDVKAIDFESLSNTPKKQELSHLMNLTKPLTPAILPHSTSQLVKPVSIVSTKSDKEAQTKPLSALLTNTADSSLIDNDPIDTPMKTDKTPLFNASINALLHAEQEQEGGELELSSKIESEKSSDKPSLVNHAKTEQLSQKITEAKQLVQHMAQNMKEAVENYKPPFTRIKMQLNPQKFGEMDVTLVQRGNNVHININANTTALTVMMQNSHELKAQLSAQGLGDASMNFSSQQQGQGDQKREEQAHHTYEELQGYEEEFTEVATALEIIVPRYI